MNLKKSTKIALAQQGKSMQELAEACGTTYNYMSQIINGRVNVGHKRLKAMADFFEMPLSEFIALGE